MARPVCTSCSLRMVAVRLRCPLTRAQAPVSPLGIGLKHCDISAGSGCGGG